MTTDEKTTQVDDTVADTAPAAKEPKPLPDDNALGTASAADDEIEDEDDESEEDAALRAEIEAILDDPEAPFALADGTLVRVNRMRTREALSLIGIFTAGAADVITQTKFSMNMDPSEFAGIFIGSILFSVPEQQNETVDFVLKMIRPAKFIADAQTPQERESNDQMMSQMRIAILGDTGEANPDLMDTFAVLKRVIAREAPNLLALGKQIAILLEVQGKARIAKNGSRKNSSTS